MTGQITNLAAQAAVADMQRSAARQRVAGDVTTSTERPRRRSPFAARLRFAPRAA